MTPTMTTPKVTSHGLDTPARRLIPELGRFGARWTATAAALLCVLALGVYAYAQQEIHGEGITGMRTIGAGGATWGLYIVAFVFFVGVSFAGICVAAVIRIFDIERVRALTRPAILMTIAALITGSLCVLADLGQPLAGLLNLPKYARPMSPFFGDFSIVVGGCLTANAVFLFLSGRADAHRCAKEGGRLSLVHRLWSLGYQGTSSERTRHHRVSFWLAMVILPLLVVGESTLGFIFGIQGGRPGWFNALAGPGFVVMAGVSGIGALIIIAATLRKFMHLEDIIRVEAFRWLGNILFALTAIYLYFMVAEEVTANYAAVASESKIAHEVVFGVYAPLFWTTVTCLVAAFVLLFVQFVRRKSLVSLTVAAGVLVNVAAVLKRYLIVVPSQTHGMLLPYEPGVYSPTWIEYSVVAGLLAFGVLMYMTFVKIFPIVPVESSHVEEAAPRRSSILRPALFVTTLATGLGLAVTGFLYSARFGTDPYSDPALPYAPVIFIMGVVTCLMSAVVYEIVPDRPVAPQLKTTPTTAPALAVDDGLALQ